jgi:orotidine-5'-phosphate decarboxylase
VKNFADILLEQSLLKKSILVTGLDPDIASLPLFLTDGIAEDNFEGKSEAFFCFNKMVIDEVYEHSLAVKPQLAYYEVYGSHGIKALEETISYAHSKGLIVINDAKRGDIGSTSQAYAKAFLGKGPLAGDMVTVNPYLGSDGYTPFIEMAEKNQKGIFLLLKTSNPSSREIQDLILTNGKLVYEEIALQFNHLSEKTLGEKNYSFIGVVAGATHPDALEKLRKTLPHSIFLVPGFGAQGGKASDLKALFDKDGNGAVINSSRDIIYAYRKKTEDWKNLSEKEVRSAIHEAALKSKNEINAVRSIF